MLNKLLAAAVAAAMTLPMGAITKKEALDFLYSSMSLPDKADYPAEFYEANVDASLRAMEEMPWGKSVPDREFLHFVLPVRVNNENLDMSRQAFYSELSGRVRGLSMRDAILEVNHWCHEKVTYRPSDARTSSPLSTVSQAIGRCGEESTFAVAALRSVGIPARQIYTPRWAHTDDNHAWVEAWADGEWFFLGACEPEPVLNLAWFNAPASRGLLMSTKVTGVYNGPEEVLLREPLATHINVTSNYAPVDTLRAVVTRPDGTPAAGAKVNFCIYNYTDFYPAVSKTADGGGEASLVAGLGDMLVWATDGSRFGFAKGRPGERVKVVLDKDASWEGVVEFDLTPPASRDAAPKVSAAAREENNRRFAIEDSIRGAYTATFSDDRGARPIAAELGLDPDSLAGVLVKSRGNHRNIVECLAGMEPGERSEALSMLLNVTEKDLRDIPAEVIEDHVSHAIPRDSVGDRVSRDVYSRYILSPRIENEGLRPWRGYLADALSSKGIGRDADALVACIDGNIAPADAENPLRLRMSPRAVMETGRADALSRGIFFVAAARTLGIPARIDPVTGDVRYMTDDGGWRTVRFASEADASRGSATGTLRLTFTPEGYIVDPKYYTQFSVARIDGGVPRQLEFAEDGTAASLFANPVELEAGQYMVVTGQRLADGGVLARCEFFNLAPGGHVERPLTIRRDEGAVSVIGSLNAENIYRDLALGADKSLLSTTGRGYYVLGLIQPGHEPSVHALNDISAVARQLEETGMKIMLLFDNEENALRFNREAFPNLPSNVVFGVDKDGASRRELAESLHLDNPAAPVFVIADTFNRVVWLSTGYTIGIGERLLDILHRVRSGE